jgi:Superinfection immunity protein
MLLDSTATDGGSALGGFILLVLILVVYFIPTFVAGSRHTVNSGAVFVINLFLGWTFIGWVVALAMAAGGMTKQQFEGRPAAQTPTAVAPVISPDGKSWWDGQRWQPLPGREDESPKLPPRPPPRPMSPL